MKSQPLVTAEVARARRTVEAVAAAEITERFPGWHVFSSRGGDKRLATRTGNQHPPDGDDAVWAATLIGDSWRDLELQLAEQAQHDAELTYQVAL
jgi:3'-phosphoadenosine 5'-phosphosulfate sulfotransferase